MELNAKDKVIIDISKYLQNDGLSLDKIAKMGILSNKIYVIEYITPHCTYPIKLEGVEIRFKPEEIIPILLEIN